MTDQTPEWWVLYSGGVAILPPQQPLTALVTIPFATQQGPPVLAMQSWDIDRISGDYGDGEG